MLEKQIETLVCDYAVSNDLLVYKFTSPSRAAVPDRMFVRPDGVIFFIEFKREGQKPTPAQEREHRRLRGCNVRVFVVDNVDGGKSAIDEMTASPCSVAYEREACARIAESTVCDMHLETGVRIYGSRVAAAIRARG